MTLPDKVTIYEVGARDGLQNEKEKIDTQIKVSFINKLSQCGFKNIETTSFVSPKWVPQMSDNSKVLSLIKRFKEVSYPVLTPNIRGLNDALDSKVDTVCVFATASKTFSQKNTNTTIPEAIKLAGEVTYRALKSGVRVRGYISCVLGCPYEGNISFKETAKIAKLLVDMGCYEISLGDTVGYGTPLGAKNMVEEVASQVDISKLAAHFHDTYGQALANLYSVLQLGITTIDSSVGGLGGCPYAKGAKGNVATEDVLYMLEGMGIKTNININEVIEAAWFIFNELGRVPNSRLALTRKH